MQRDALRDSAFSYQRQCFFVALLCLKSTANAILGLSVAAVSGHAVPISLLRFPSRGTPLPIVVCGTDTKLWGIEHHASFSLTIGALVSDERTNQPLRRSRTPAELSSIEEPGVFISDPHFFGVKDAQRLNSPACAAFAQVRCNDGWATRKRHILWFDRRRQIAFRR